MQHAAEGAHFARGLGCCIHEGAALVLGEIEATAFGVVELHACPGLTETVHMNSVSWRAQGRHGRGRIVPDKSRPGWTSPACSDTELTIVSHLDGNLLTVSDFKIMSAAPLRIFEWIQKNKTH